VPYERFTIRSSADVTTFVLLLVVGGIVPQLAGCARRLKVVAITDERYLAQIHQTAVLAANSPEDVVEHVRGQLIGLLGLQAWRFEHGSLAGHPPQLQSDGAVVTAGAAGTWTKMACPARRSSCGYSATASTAAGSCSPHAGLAAVPAGAPGGRRAGRAG
jgi:hypothetical protein